MSIGSVALDCSLQTPIWVCKLNGMIAFYVLFCNSGRHSSLVASLMAASLLQGFNFCVGKEKKERKENKVSSFPTCIYPYLFESSINAKAGFD